MASIRLGTVGDWIASGVALVAIFETLHLWRRDKHDAVTAARARDDAERREIAARVNAWLDFKSAADMNETGGSPQLIIENRTEMPLYRWRIGLFVDPPAREFTFDENEFGVVPPYGGRLHIGLRDVPTGSTNKSEFDFSYLLADGSSWLRDRDGLLQETPRASVS